MVNHIQKVQKVRKDLVNGFLNSALIFAINQKDFLYHVQYNFIWPSR